MSAHSAQPPTHSARPTHVGYPTQAHTFQHAPLNNSTRPITAYSRLTDDGNPLVSHSYPSSSTYASLNVAPIPHQPQRTRPQSAMNYTPRPTLGTSITYGASSYTGELLDDPSLLNGTRPHGSLPMPNQRPHTAVPASQSYNPITNPSPSSTSFKPSQPIVSTFVPQTYFPTPAPHGPTSVASTAGRSSAYHRRPAKFTHRQWDSSGLFHPVKDGVRRIDYLASTIDMSSDEGRDGWVPANGPHPTIATRRPSPKRHQQRPGTSPSQRNANVNDSPLPLPLSQSMLDARAAVLRYFAQPTCFLFAESPGIVAVSDEDIDLLIRKNGGLDSTLAMLRMMEGESMRFAGFEALLEDSRRRNGWRFDSPMRRSPSTEGTGPARSGKNYEHSPYNGPPPFSPRRLIPTEQVFKPITRRSAMLDEDGKPMLRSHAIISSRMIEYERQRRAAEQSEYRTRRAEMSARARADRLAVIEARQARKAAEAEQEATKEAELARAKLAKAREASKKMKEREEQAEEQRLEERQQKLRLVEQEKSAAKREQQRKEEAYKRNNAALKKKLAEAKAAKEGNKKNKKTGTPSKSSTQSDAKEEAKSPTQPESFTSSNNMEESKEDVLTHQVVKDSNDNTERNEAPPASPHNKLSTHHRTDESDEKDEKTSTITEDSRDTQEPTKPPAKEDTSSNQSLTANGDTKNVSSASDISSNMPASDSTGDASPQSDSATTPLTQIESTQDAQPTASTPATSPTVAQSDAIATSAPAPSQSTDSATLCDNCFEEFATLWCADCKMNLCQVDCDKAVHIFAATRDHKRTPLGHDRSATATLTPTASATETPITASTQTTKPDLEPTQQTLTSTNTTSSITKPVAIIDTDPINKDVSDEPAVEDTKADDPNTTESSLDTAVAGADNAPSPTKADSTRADTLLSTMDSDANEVVQPAPTHAENHSILPPPSVNQPAEFATDSVAPLADSGPNPSASSGSSSSTSVPPPAVDRRSTRGSLRLDDDLIDELEELRDEDVLITPSTDKPSKPITQPTNSSTLTKVGDTSNHESPPPNPASTAISRRSSMSIGDTLADLDDDLDDF